MGIHRAPTGPRPIIITNSSMINNQWSCTKRTEGHKAWCYREMNHMQRALVGVPSWGTVYMHNLRFITTEPEFTHL